MILLAGEMIICFPLVSLPCVLIFACNKTLCWDWCDSLARKMTTCFTLASLSLCYLVEKTKLSLDSCLLGNIYENEEMLLIAQLKHWKHADLARSSLDMLWNNHTWDMISFYMYISYISIIALKKKLSPEVLDESFCAFVHVVIMNRWPALWIIAVWRNCHRPSLLCNNLLGVGNIT